MIKGGIKPRAIAAPPLRTYSTLLLTIQRKLLRVFFPNGPIVWGVHDCFLGGLHSHQQQHIMSQFEKIVL